MGAKGAVEIIFRGKDVEENTVKYTERFANPLVAAHRGFIDDVIDPAKTRQYIAEELELLKTKSLENPPRKHSNVPL